MLVLTLLRLFIWFQAYLYHSSIGLFHLFFVLMTFVINEQVVFFIAVSLMMPVYAWEFSV